MRSRDAEAAETTEDTIPLACDSLNLMKGSAAVDAMRLSLSGITAAADFIQLPRSGAGNTN